MSVIQKGNNTKSYSACVTSFKFSQSHRCKYKKYSISDVASDSKRRMHKKSLENYNKPTY